MQPYDKNPPTITSITALARPDRDSLEVFNPSSSPKQQPRHSPYTTWQNQRNSLPETQPEVTKPSLPPPPEEKGVTSWMVLPETIKTSPSPSIPIFSENEITRSDESPLEAAAQRAAEWGLVLKTDSETGKPKGVEVRKSRDRTAGIRRDSSGSARSSDDLTTTGKEKGIPRVSEDLKDALSAFQQTFVVSDATKPDHPILYASAGFFKGAFACTRNL